MIAYCVKRGENMRYNELKNLDDSYRNTLSSMFVGMLSNIKNTSFRKMSAIIKDIPAICKMSYESYENSQLRKMSYNKVHPIVPIRGEIYNAFITEGVGKELCGTHPVLIVQNQTQNIHAEKVNILPLEGDGNKINPKYQVQITSQDMENNATLSKDPSRVIISDIMTIDKARLGKKIGKLKQSKMDLINQTLKIQLDL
jgi:mRNA-degrading endonuclease toxin of MazEF toxin-antitoxin module